MSRNTARRYSARNPGRAPPPGLPPSIFSLMFPPDYREWFLRQGGYRCHASASRSDRSMVRLVNVLLVTDVPSVLKMSAFGRGQRRLTGNLVGSPAPHRVSVGTRFERWYGLAMTHGFGMATARTERASVRRIERTGKLALGRS